MWVHILRVKLQFVVLVKCCCRLQCKFHRCNLHLKCKLLSLLLCRHPWIKCNMKLFNIVSFINKTLTKSSSCKDSYDVIWNLQFAVSAASWHSIVTMTKSPGDLWILNRMNIQINVKNFPAQYRSHWSWCLILNKGLKSHLLFNYHIIWI